MLIRRMWKLGRRKLVIYFSIFISFMLFYNWVTTEYGNPSSLNYFLEKYELDKYEYLVQTPTCKIIKFSPWDAAILPFIKPHWRPPDCRIGKNWVWLQETSLHMDYGAIVASGYSKSSIKCCYKGILRVEQSIENYDGNADNNVRYTEECLEMGDVTPLKYEFVRVFCFSTSWPLYREVVYREFFAAVLVNEKIERKFNYWKGKKIPPSVLILGIDAISRMNYHRSFPKTDKFLKKIGAVELLGYTKVAENTHPNAVAFLSGYELGKQENLCMRTSSTPQDNCPYIWKRFTDSEYLTGTVEDAPGLVGFNYLKLGFVKQPTDFYFRPFMLAVHKSLLRKDYYHTDCISQKSTEETLLQYVRGIMSFSARAPIFIHSWMTSLAHLDINSAKFGDEKIASILQEIDLSNTILLFMSDHGQRYGAIRETLPGWYEDKLPMISIYLPPTVKKRFPEWNTTLQNNANRLTSPFDVYKTMEQVLVEFSGQTIQQRAYGESLFTPIATSRTCKDAGIPVNYCACVPPQKVDSSSPEVVLAAKTAVEYLNKAIPPQCNKAELDQIVAAAFMADNENATKGTYIVSFYTVPGQFLFEATVDYAIVGDKREYKVTTDLLRMNSITTYVGCVDTALLERYCYCNLK